MEGWGGSVARAGHGDEEPGEASLARQIRYIHAPFCQMTRGARSQIACHDAERGAAQSFKAPCSMVLDGPHSALEATQGQMNGFLSQPPYTRY